MSAPIPDSIGPYDVVRPIARGGMAEVFEVVEPASGERRALKLLTELKTSFKRFNREFEALTRLNHPGIVRVYRFGLYGGRQPWMSMELLDGLPLQERMAQVGPPGSAQRTREVLGIAYQLAGSLQYIHDRGLIHRDLKSANIQVLRDGRVKLLDFGTAHLIDPLEKITLEGDFVGTFSYAAPEQIVGARVDHRADIYAFGVLLYRLLTGRRPFKASDPHEVARMHLQVHAKPITRVVPSLDSRLDALVQRMMAKPRHARPARAEDVGREIERIAGEPLGLAANALALYDDQSVGRAAEQRMLWTDLEASPPGHVVVLCGGDDPERRRFTHQAGRDAAKRGWWAMGCAPGVDPAAELSQALAMLVVGDDAEGVMLRQVFHGPSGARPEVVRSLLPTIVARLAASRVSTLFVVDDLPGFGALEVETISRLASLARQRGAPLRMILGADDAENVVVGRIAAHAQSASRLLLTGLDAKATGLAVAHLLHRRPPPPGTVRRLLSATGGHPTLITSMVHEMASRGEIEVRGADGARIEWLPSEDPEIGERLPEPVRFALEQRIRDLSVVEIRALEVLAVAGGSTHAPVIARAMGMRPEQAELLLRGLVEQGHIAWEGLPASPASVPDPLLVRWLDETVSSVRRLVIQYLIADAVEQQEQSAAQVRILLGVGRYPVAAVRAVAVAAALLRRGRAADAAELLDDVRPHVDDPALGVDSRIRFHLLYAAALHRVRPTDPRAVKAVQAAEALAHDDPSRAFVAFEQAELQGGIGHYANQRRYLGEAWDRLADKEPSRLRGDVVLELARAHMHRAELREAQRWLEQAMDDARKTNDREVYDRARVGLGRLSLASGDAAGAEATFADVIETERNHPDPAIRHLAIAGWGHALRWQGRWSEAIGPLARAAAEARQHQSVTSWTEVAFSAAAVELDLYRLGRAQEFIEELVQAIGPGERLQLRLATRLWQARITLASGQIGQAAFALHEVMDQADKGGLVLLACQARAFLAEARWMQGAADEARELYKRSMITLMSAGDLFALSDAVISRARAIGGQEDPTKAFLLLRKLDDAALLPLQVEKRLARARWLTATEGRLSSRLAWHASEEAITRVADRQESIERAALRVHPWTHEVHAATHERMIHADDSGEFPAVG